ncbi:MAG: arylesterase [Gammaproteobacteria bacterium]|nr:arylesterase [Gammaproteobacteria bacterium]
MVRLLLISILLTFNMSARAESPVILVLGDSLSAGYGVANGRNWVELLAQRLEQKKLDYHVVNASISGETTLGGLSRLDELLARHRPAVLVLGLGGNDGLRALPVKTIRQNLDQMIQSARDAGSKVLLLGIRIPPNYGPVYTRAFSDIYGDLAGRYKLQWVPFLLEGVALKAGMMQADGIHPSESAQPAILENVWSQLKPLL